MTTSLPIDSLLDDIRQNLSSHNRLLLSAAPGAGKTTRVPLALMNERWLDGRKILMLEPRRIATRNAATYMAQQLGESVGQSVGYRIRLETRVSADTRIEVVTEGILTRMLQQDPELADVGLIIFDEFHERNLHADLALALVQQAQELLRDDLRLLVMSATLDNNEIRKTFDAPFLHSEGRTYPIELHYRPKDNDNVTLAQQVSRVVSEALTHEGDILVFLPGTAEIRQLQALLDEKLQGVTVLPLHGQLNDQQQKQALAPAIAGQRRIILATNIAESSVTIDGVRIVIDSGLERRVSFQPATGTSQLQTRYISQASAIQRSGRAGRQAAGICYRLWPQSQQERLEQSIRPEILDADLTSLLLQLKLWGADADELNWVTAPPSRALSHARTLLSQLNMTADDQLTDHGRQCATLPTEPRWSHALISAAQLGVADKAATIIALLQEWPHKLRASDDLQRLLNQAERHALWKQRVNPLASNLLRLLDSGISQADGISDTDATALILALAWPDRIAQRRSDSDNFLLANGVGARLAANSDWHHAQWLAVADLSGSGSNGNTIRMAAELSVACIERLQSLMPALFTSSAVVRWLDNGQLQCEQQQRLGALILNRQPLTTMTHEDWQQVWLDFFHTEGLNSLSWNEEAQSLRQRLALLHQHDSSQWPDVSDEGLKQTAEDWLLPFCQQARHQRDLKKIDTAAAIRSLLPWDKLQQLDQLTPTHWQVASGSHIRIDYSQTPPVLAVKLQEMFGYEGQPSIIDQRQPLLIHLLSPAGRPLQVTSDLPHFWRNTYSEVRKDMRGRYPKHPWPEDPLTFTATRLTNRALNRNKQ